MSALDLPLIASGRTADVFALDGDRVLRRYRAGDDATGEMALMRYVAQHGFPAPAAYEATGPDLVLERLDGPTMLEALLAGGIAPVTAGEVLAELHDRLHALPPRLVGHRDDRILHLDLHPANVVLTGRGPVLIDWRNACEGAPELDVALAALILGEAVAGSYVPPEVVPLARDVLAAFLARVGHDPLRQLNRAAQMRRADPNLTVDEIARLDRAAELVRRAAAAA
jgi:Ser/Thr protein kinase RdoA (MazF antagonist)